MLQKVDLGGAATCSPTNILFVRSETTATMATWVLLLSVWLSTTSESCPPLISFKERGGEWGSPKDGQVLASSSSHSPISEDLSCH